MIGDTPGTAGRPQRLFVAYDIPTDAAARIAAWQQRELVPRRELRINRGLHLTLCFLGSTPAAHVADVEGVLETVAPRRVTVGVGAPVFLPERGRKKVLALPLVAGRSVPRGLDRLRETQAEIAAALARRHLCTPESRPWLPHLTVARFRRPGHPFDLQNVNFGELLLSRVVLYTSVLDRSGAVHSPLRTYSAR